MKEIWSGLEENKLLDYNYVLSGYVGSASCLSEMSHLIRHIKSASPKTIYGRVLWNLWAALTEEIVLDPVLGDNGQLYVPAETIPIYRDSLCSLADLMTPNQYEAEYTV